MTYWISWDQCENWTIEVLVNYFDIVFSGFPGTKCEDWTIEVFVDYFDLGKQAKHKIQGVLNRMKL